MILQRLHEYYGRSIGSGNALPPPGWERKRIPYVIEITATGRFVKLTSLRTGPRPSNVTALLVPQAAGRSGSKAYEQANLLWDHLGYVLGHPKTASPKDVELAGLQHESFRRRLAQLASALPANATVQAVTRFYENGQVKPVRDDPEWPNCLAIPGCNLTFRLDTAADFVAQDPEIARFVDEMVASPTTDEADRPGVCLVTGNHDVIARLHPAISGIGQKPAPLAAINNQSLPALASYGKDQGENFPVSRQAAFTYSTSLNHLLAPQSRQRIRLGDATIVFWAKRADALEDELVDILGEDLSDPNAHVQQIRALYEAIDSGAFDGARGDNAFHLLTLAPNSARIVVRDWFTDSLGNIARNIRRWFDDLAIAHAPEEPDYPGLLSLLLSTAPLGKFDNVNPPLADGLLRSAVSGGLLPDTVLSAVLQRCVADQAAKSDRTGKPIRNVSRPRAALLKAALNRRIRMRELDMKEVSEALDVEAADPPYLLGRLFATYERIQADAAERELNRGIRDAFFGSAMTTPRGVLPRLVQLSQHHMRDLRRHAPGLHTLRDKLLGEIWAGLPAGYQPPASHSLVDRARFALGYYHQRQHFYAKSDKSSDVSTAQDASGDH